MRPLPVQMKHCLVVAFESVLRLRSIYARVQDDNKTVSVYLLADEHTDDVYDCWSDGETTMMALFPKAEFEYRVIALQGRDAASTVDNLFRLKPEHKVY